MEITAVVSFSLLQRLLANNEQPRPLLLDTKPRDAHRNINNTKLCKTASLRKGISPQAF